MRDQIYEELDTEPEMRCFSITTDKRFGITVNPYPINEEDLLDCNGEIPKQFEESLDDHEKLMSLLEDSYSLCNVHNALVNVSRFKEMRDGIKSELGDDLAGPAPSQPVLDLPRVGSEEQRTPVNRRMLFPWTR